MELVPPHMLCLHKQKRETVGEPPTYALAKAMRPVQVSDRLLIPAKPDNLSLCEFYFKTKRPLIPVSRVSSHEPKEGFPSRVLLELTSRCNQRCSMCPSKHLTRPRCDMPLDVIERCLDEMSAHGVAGVWLYYVGEPMMHPGFKEILKLVAGRENLGTIWLSSNLRAMTPDIMEAILASSVTYLNVSVNAATKEEFERVTPGGGWDRLRVNLNLIAEAKKSRPGQPPFLRVQTVDQPGADVDGFIKLHAGLADMISVNALEKRALVAGADPADREPLKSCRKLERRYMIVLSNGETVLCDADFDARNSMGSVLRASMADIWNSEGRRDMEHLNQDSGLASVPVCSGCSDNLI